MAAITWRNINGPSNDGVSDMLESSRRSFDSSFDALAGMAQRQQGLQKARHQKTVQDNTQSFLDQVAQYRTPEELQQAREAGVFQKLREQYGTNVDRSQIRGAVTSQLANTRDQQMKANAYSDQVRDRNERGKKDSILQKIAAGNTKGAQADLDNLDLRNEAPLQKALADAQRQIKTDQRDDKKWDRTQQLWGQQDAQYADSREDRALVEAERAREAAANKTVTSALANRKNQLKQQDMGAKSLAKDLGIPIVNGLPDQSQATPEQWAAYEQQVAEAGLFDVPSETEVINNVTQKLLQSGEHNFTPQEVAAVGNTLDQLLQESTKLRTKDQAALNNQITKVSSQYDAQVEEANRQWEDQLANDPMLKTIWDPEATTASVMESLNVEEFDTWGLEAEDIDNLRSAVNDFMSEGMVVPDANGNPTRQPVTPGMAKLAIKMVEDNWENVPGDFRTAIEEMTKTPEYQNRVNRAHRAHEKHQARVNAIQTAKMQETMKETQRFMHSRGMGDASVPNMLNTMRLNGRSTR